MTDKEGNRTVALLIPFEFNGERVESLTLRAFEFGDQLDWQVGRFRSALHLLTVLTGKSEAILRKIKYPDVDRVMSEFLQMHVPQIVRDDIVNGTIPQRVQRAPVQDMNTPVEDLEPSFGPHEEDPPPARGPQDFPGYQPRDPGWEDAQHDDGGFDLDH